MTCLCVACVDTLSSFITTRQKRYNKVIFDNFMVFLFLHQNLNQMQLSLTRYSKKIVINIEDKIRAIYYSEDRQHEKSRIVFPLIFEAPTFDKLWNN